MKTRNNGFGSRLLMALTFLFLYAPIIILIVFSFNAGNSSSVWKGFSLHWYGELFHNRLIMHSVYITLMVSLLATVIATLAGTFASIGLYSMRRKKPILSRAWVCACCLWCSSTAGVRLPGG